MTRSDAKNSISMKDYKDAMKGIFHEIHLRLIASFDF